MKKGFVAFLGLSFLAAIEYLLWNVILAIGRQPAVGNVEQAYVGLYVGLIICAMPLALLGYIGFLVGLEEL